MDLVESNLGIDSWIKHWIAWGWIFISFTVSDIDCNSISMTVAVLNWFILFLANVKRSYWNLVLDDYLLVISSSFPDEFIMIEARDSTRKTLSFTKLEMNLKLIVYHAFHHLLSNLERTNFWWWSSTSFSLFNFIKDFNYVWLSSTTFQEFTCFADG